MKSARFMRVIATLASGAMMLQIGGCTFQEINEFVQTIFLGITAAGGIAILQNI